MPQPVEDEAEIVADGAENGVGVIAMATLEVIATEMAVALQVPDLWICGQPPAPKGARLPTNPQVAEQAERTIDVL